MSITQETIPSYTIKQLFESSDQYVIPVYQRNYAWGLGEITQLIQDVQDYVGKETPYYIGTLVVAEKTVENDIFYETIDGQQRLTTLTILLNALHRYLFYDNHTMIDLNLKLRFYSRPKSTETLKVVANKLDRSVNFISTKEYNVNIQSRYIDAENLLKQLFNSKDEVYNFYKYLTEKVTLIRVSVPKDTDLNHYFEVMNNRGEQLEKHEVLKANLLGKFDENDKERDVFSKVWEAVSDMERYVQYGFSTSERDKIFGNDDCSGLRWNTLQVNSFDELVTQLDSNHHNSIEKHTTIKQPTLIEEIVDYTGNFYNNSENREEAPERFNSVINFPSFLLHVLKIQKQEDVKLDDKSIISSFKVLSTIDEIKEFGFNLLKGKHLFDQYVIKREFIGDKDNWSLKRLKWYGTGGKNRVSYVNTFGDEDKTELNRNILMLLGMFHVSLPSMNYKHWLSASLNYLFKKEKVSGEEYSKYLFQVAKSYFYDRILNPEKELDYFHMIFNQGYVKRRTSQHNLDFNKLDNGTAVENFAFNFVDYLLWINNKTKYQDFEYTFRSSVEHYYPQHPINGNELNDVNASDNFGNLCLISSSKNSKLSNYMPLAKKDHYSEQKVPDSLKQALMMQVTTTEIPWNSEAIKNHKKDMIILINKYYSDAHQ